MAGRGCNRSTAKLSHGCRNLQRWSFGWGGGDCRHSDRITGPVRVAMATSQYTGTAVLVPWYRTVAVIEVHLYTVLAAFLITCPLLPSFGSFSEIRISSGCCYASLPLPKCRARCMVDHAVVVTPSLYVTDTECVGHICRTIALP